MFSAPLDLEITTYCTMQFWNGMWKIHFSNIHCAILIYMIKDCLQCHSLKISCGEFSCLVSCRLILILSLVFWSLIKSVLVSEPEGTAEAEIASSPVSAAAAGVSLGMSGHSHTTWPPPPSPHLAEVPTALPQTAWTRVWVRCTIIPISSQRKRKKG